MSDPRPPHLKVTYVDEHGRVHVNHERAMERIEAHLSPADDELPLPQAIRHRDELEQHREKKHRT